LLLESLDLVSKDQSIEPLGEPDLDIDSVNIPEEGDFEYEFSIEVRPQITIPDFTKIEIEKPDASFDKDDLARYKRYLQYNYGEFTKVDEPAQYHDKVTATMVFTHNGQQLNSIESRQFRVCEKISFEDAELAGFDKLVIGKNAGDTCETDFTISSESPDIEMRGETVHAHISIESVQRNQNPEVFTKLVTMFNRESEADLDEWLTTLNTRQYEYQSRQAARKQLMSKIAESADWDLPEDLVSRQHENALRREILELRQAGYSKEEINGQINHLRRNMLTMTRNNLKQHFILDKIAAQQGISVTPEEIEAEIEVMATNEGENARRLRARLVKNEMLENLDAQLRERKTVDYILSQVKIKTIPAGEKDGDTTFAIRHTICQPAPTTSNISIANEHDHDHDCHDENCTHDHDH
jgi:trigger factor